MWLWLPLGFKWNSCAAKNIAAQNEASNVFEQKRLWF